MSKKQKMQASDVEVGNRSLDAVLLDLAERSTRAEEEAAIAVKKIDASLERIDAMMGHLAALTRDHIAVAGRTGQVEARLDALEKAS